MIERFDLMKWRGHREEIAFGGQLWKSIHSGYVKFRYPSRDVEYKVGWRGLEFEGEERANGVHFGIINKNGFYFCLFSPFLN